MTQAKHKRLLIAYASTSKCRNCIMDDALSHFFHDSFIKKSRKKRTRS